MSNTPRIYIACLSAYNNGKLHGAWIDCDDTVDSVQAQIDTMLANSPEEDAEEWAIHDYEGFGEYKVSEHEDLDDLVELAELIATHDKPVLALLTEEVHIDRVKTLMEDGFLGEFNSVVDYAYEIVKDTENLSEFAEMYFDYESFARDLEMSGDIRSIEYNNSVFIFDNNV